MPTLRDYFTQMHDSSLAPEEKLRIYQRFLDKSHRVLMRHKVAYYSRVTAFWVLTFVMVGGAFYLFNPGTNPYQVDKLWDGLMALKSQNGAYVHAETIWRIINARGNMTITTADGEQIDGSELHNNDKVLLEAWAEVLITVSNGFQAKIIGPAVFMIEDDGLHGDVHLYTINLLEGDYMELAKIEDSKAPKNKTTQIESVIVKTDDFHLEQLHADSKLDIIINTTTKGQKTITNHGDDILVKKIVKDSEDKIYAAVGEDQTVLVNGDIELIEEDVVKLVKDIEDNQLTIRYDLDGEGAALLKDSTDTDSAEGNADAKGNVPVKDEAASLSTLSSLLGADTSTKQVIDEKTMADITSALSSTFVSQDLAQVRKHYEGGEDTPFAIAYTNLTRRLQRVADILGIALPQMTIGHDHLSEGSAAASLLLVHLESNYYIAPASIDSLNTIISSLNALQLEQFGTAKIDTTPVENPWSTDLQVTPTSTADPVSDTSTDIQTSLDIQSSMTIDQ